MDRTDVGPRAVVAGECDRCGQAPRILPTCGPIAHEALCRACALEIGDDAWCEGHAEDGRRHLRWATALPSEWPQVVRLWWVATGEVRLDQLVLTPETVAALDSQVQIQLPERGT